MTVYWFVSHVNILIHPHTVSENIPIDLSIKIWKNKVLI